MANTNMTDVFADLGLIKESVNRLQGMARLGRTLEQEWDREGYTSDRSDIMAGLNLAMRDGQAQLHTLATSLLTTLQSYLYVSQTGPEILTTSVVGGHGSLSPATGRQGHDAEVALVAVPDVGYQVHEWSGTDDDALLTNANTVTMDGAKTVTVEFEIAPVYTLTVSAGGNGSITIPASATTRYQNGTVVELLAAPLAGYKVAAWSGTDDDLLVTNANTVTMIGNKTVSVTFEAE